jgi:hypothetical protein
MRLVERDRGCVICLAAGIHAPYKYSDDSNRFEGAHIVPFACQELVGLSSLIPSLFPAYHVVMKWDRNTLSSLVTDPFTDPINADCRFASPTTRTKKDPRRINSLENGILLCLEHHRGYDNFRFSIHADVSHLSTVLYDL